MSSNRPTSRRIDKITDLDGIRHAMAQVLQDAQMSLAGHRKLVVIMRNIQNRAISLGYEEGFILNFTRFLNKILPLKKGEEVGDRIAKFCSVFLASLYKDERETSPPEDDDEEADTPTGRFVDYLLRHLLRGIQAKDRNVRYRVAQLLAYLVNFIGEIDEELFKALHWSLSRRLNDREPNVRIQAVVAISRFQYVNLPSDDFEEDESMNKATKSLIQVLENDESAEVRRAALLNLIKNEQTLPFLVERARDVNNINRRLTYSRILKEVGDFRKIPPHLRECLISWGLNDRDESVKNAATKVFNNYWFEAAGKDFIEFIENLTLLDNNEADITLVKQLIASRFDVVSSMEISKTSWKELTIEKSFLLRNVYQYMNENSMYDMIDKKFLDSIELSEILYKYLKLRNIKLNENKKMLEDIDKFKLLMENFDANLSQIQHDKNLLLAEDTTDSPNVRLKVTNFDTDFEKLNDAKEQEIESHMELVEEYQVFKDDLKQLEFIIEQLLIISKDYDFSDETGRRSMLQIIRSSLTNDNLTDKLIESSLKVLKKLSINERDFTSMCTEIITDIRDSFMDENDETFHSAVSGLSQSDDDDDDDEELGNQNDVSNDLNRIQNVFDNEQFANNSYLQDSRNKRRKIEPKVPPDEIVIQCLQITQHLLELINESLDNNYSLGSLIESLIIPAVLRSEKPFKRKLGMKCMGLFALLDKQLAIQNLYILGMAASKGDEELRIICVKIIIDILSVFGTGVLDVESESLGETRLVDSLSLAKLFYKLLRSNEMPQLQAVVAEGLCKLFLADVLEGFGKSQNDDEESEDEKEDPEKQLFETLILAYFHPDNADNHALRQTLAFCIPVYAFSHSKHQLKIAHISGDCFFRMFRVDGEISDISKATLIIQQLIHWCDPQNLVNSQDEINDAPLWQALSFLQVIEQDTPKNIKKCIINNLGKLNIEYKLGSKILKGLSEAVEDTIQLIDDERPTKADFNLDSLTIRNFVKFQTNLQSLVEKAEEEEINNQPEEAEVEVEEPEPEVPEPEADPNVDESEKQDVDMESGTEQNSEEPETQKSTEPEKEPEENIHDSLAEIDDFLDAEENVDYDMSMA